MQEIHSMLGRAAYQLSIASANGTYNEQERQSQQQELVELKEEISRITESTNFNGKRRILYYLFYLQQTLQRQICQWYGELTESKRRSLYF